MNKLSEIGVAELFQVHQLGVWRYVRFLGANPELAEDITQETFLALLRHPLKRQDEKATKAWLRATARNLYLMKRRRDKKRGGFRTPKVSRSSSQTLSSIALSLKARTPCPNAPPRKTRSKICFSSGDLP